MPNLPSQIEVDLLDFFHLLNYYWSAVNSSMGELGPRTFEDTVLEIGKNSKISLSPTQLEDLVFQMKEALFEKKKPYVERRPQSYHPLMRRLKDQVPALFKEMPSGEIVFINFRDKEDKK